MIFWIILFGLVGLGLWLKRETVVSWLRKEAGKRKVPEGYWILVHHAGEGCQGVKKMTWMYRDKPTPNEELYSEAAEKVYREMGIPVVQSKKEPCKIEPEHHSMFGHLWWRK